jgi:hypothetical protein
MIPQQNTEKGTLHRQTPKEYADSIKAFASEKKLSSLHPGDNFRPLAEFLQCDDRLNRDVHDYVIVHDLSYDINDARRTTHFSASQVRDFANYRMPTGSSGQVIFLRGYPSPAWLNLIGAKYQVDPEIFRRYLAFKVPTEDFFDLPGPSPASHSILKLSITSIGKQCGSTIGRDSGPAALKTHFNSLGANAVSNIGNSIVRRFNWHDQKYFSLEQNIHASIIMCETGWVCKFYFLLLFDRSI